MAKMSKQDMAERLVQINAIFENEWRLAVHEAAKRMAQRIDAVVYEYADGDDEKLRHQSEIMVMVYEMLAAAGYGPIEMVH